MASRIIAQGNEKQRRMTRRRTIAKKKKKKKKKTQRRSTARVTTIEDAFSKLDAVSARRATVSPSVASAARRSSANRKTLREDVSKPTNHDDDTPKRLSIIRARPSSARLLASRIPQARSSTEMRVPTSEEMSRDSDGLSSSIDRLSPVKVVRSGSVHARAAHMPSMDSPARMEKSRQLSIAKPSVKSMFSALKRKLSQQDPERQEAKEEEEEEEEEEEDEDEEDEEQHMEELRERAKELQAMITKKGIRLWKDASNYDPKRGCLKHVGTVKACVEFKKYPEILCLYRKPGALAYVLTLYIFDFQSITHATVYNTDTHNMK
mgnify:CR=1 FL=1